MRRALVTLLILTAATLGCSSSNPSAGKGAEAGGPSDSLYPFTLMRQGSALLQQGRTNDALEKFQQAAQLQPTNATVHNMIGLCYLRLKQYDKAVASFSHALDLVPAFTDARNNRGAAYLALGQYHMAEVDFTGVLSDTTYPHRFQVYYNLGMTFLQRGDLATAEEDFRKAANAPSPVFPAFLRLADIAESQGQLDTAIEHMEQAHFAFPDRVEATLRLGQLLLEAGRKDEGKKYLEQVIQGDPGSSNAAEARRILDQH